MQVVEELGEAQAMGNESTEKDSLLNAVWTNIGKRGSWPVPQMNRDSYIFEG